MRGLVGFTVLLVLCFGAMGASAAECAADDVGLKGAALLVRGGGAAQGSGKGATYLQGADPFVLSGPDGKSYLFTTNRPAANVPVYKSQSDADWIFLGDALPRLPRWADRGRTWAPEAMRLAEGEYALWYTARHRASGKQCIGRALAGNPAGPFADNSTVPFLCDAQRERTIDPSPYRDDDGKLYLLWKTRETVHGEIRTTLWIGPLDSHGALVGSGATALLTNSEPWEGRHVEAPTLLKRAGKYLLFYSAGASTSRGYFSSYAVAQRVDGPYTKSGRVLLGGSPCMRGAGHQSVVADGRGEYRIYYHTVRPGRRESAGGNARFLDFAHLCFPAGEPVVQDRPCSG